MDKERADYEIRSAAREFEQMLREQAARNERMRVRREVRRADGRGVAKVIIGLTGGDGIGPIIMSETRRVLSLLLDKALAEGRVEFNDIGGFTLEDRLACGKTVPDKVLMEMKKCDVLLKGPTTTPSAAMNVANLESANVFLRKEFDLYANVRPINIPSEDIDWTFFRENTEGEYALGSRGVGISGILSADFKITTHEGTRRIAEAAFSFARKAGKKRLTIVTKANIMKKTDGDFLRICKEVAEDYPEVKTDSMFVDIMAANLINKDIRSGFSVFLLPNLYGDIITDEAAQIQGGVGTAGSANIGEDYAIFEAVHGSAPRMIEEGIGEKASPASLMKASAMMLEHIGFDNESRRLDAALRRADDIIGERMTGLENGASCGDYAAEVMRGLSI